MDPVLSILRSDPAREIFASHSVEDAFLFGSRARGSAQDSSDADVAVRFPKTGDAASRFAKLGAFEDDLKPLVGVPMDLVCLNDANPLLAFEAVVRGQTVYTRDRDQSFLYELLVRHRYEDYLHMQEIFTQALKRRLGLT
jgi:predicted nucleotidyltransferase